MTVLAYNQFAAPTPLVADMIARIALNLGDSALKTAERVAAGLRHARTRRQLNGMSDRMLSDIGLTRGDLVGRF